MGLGNLTTNLFAQLDNPECSYLSGMVIGAGLTSATIIRLYLIYLAFRIITNLIELGIKWVSNKIKLRKSTKEGKK